MLKSKNPMLNLSEELVQQIEQVSDHQIDELLRLVAHRFNQLRPDSEGAFLVLPRDPALRRKEIENLLQLLTEE